MTELCDACWLAPRVPTRPAAKLNSDPSLQGASWNSCVVVEVEVVVDVVVAKVADVDVVVVVAGNVASAAANSLLR